jgi:hypothetical protein
MWFPVRGVTAPLPNVRLGEKSAPQPPRSVGDARGDAFLHDRHTRPRVTVVEILDGQRTAQAPSAAIPKSYGVRLATGSLYPSQFLSTA